MASLHAEEGGRLLAEGRTDEAMAAFEAGLAQNGKDVDVLLGLARIHLSRGARDPARVVLERLLGLDPRHPEGQSHLALVRALEGDDEALAGLQEQGRKPEARFFDQFNLGAALAARGEDAAAEAAFGKAILLQPASAHARFELGRLALRRDDSTKALAHLKEAAALSPRAVAPLLLLARAQEALGASSAAVQTLMRALTVAPREKAVYQDLIALCLRAGASQVALTAAKALRELRPEDPDGAYLEGQALLARGDPARAQDSLHEAIRLDPAHWRAKQALATAYEQRGEPDVSRRLLEETLSALPDDGATHLAMARLLKAKEPAQALNHARRAQRSPDAALRAQADALVAALSS